MSANNEKRNLNVMPAASSSTSAQPAKLMNGLTWLLAGLLLIAVVAIIWLLVNKEQADRSSDVVAIVNNEEIMRDQLVEIMSEQEKFNFIDRAIFLTLVDQEAAKKKIKISEEEIERAVDRQLAEINHMFFDEMDFETTLMMQGLTMEGLKEEIRNEPDLLLQLKLEKIFADEIVITDEDIAEYYEENKEMLNYSKQIQASHILVETEELAKSILEQLNQGADFAELAKEHSTDEGTAERGGDLGRFGRGSMVQPFEEAAYNLEIGELSDIVESDFGYHIILLTDKQKMFTIEDDEDILRSYIYETEMRALMENWMEDVRAASDIEIL